MATTSRLQSSTRTSSDFGRKTSSTEDAPVTCFVVAPSGLDVHFGNHGGYVHTWDLRSTGRHVHVVDLRHTLGHSRCGVVDMCLSTHRAAELYLEVVNGELVEVDVADGSVLTYWVRDTLPNRLDPGLQHTSATLASVDGGVVFRDTPYSVAFISREGRKYVRRLPEAHHGQFCRGLAVSGKAFPCCVSVQGDRLTESTMHVGPETESPVGRRQAPVRRVRDGDEAEDDDNGDDIDRDFEYDDDIIEIS
eukprot:PhM_4_TR10748/c0_g1_i1/m.2438